MEIELWELKNIVKAAAEEAVQKYILAQNPTKDELTERQAFKEFGQGWVMNQVSLGLVKPMRRGTAKNSPKVYSRAALSDLKSGGSPLLKAIVQP